MHIVTQERCRGKRKNPIWGSLILHAGQQKIKLVNKVQGGEQKPKPVNKFLASQRKSKQVAMVNKLKKKANKRPRSTRKTKIKRSQSLNETKLAKSPFMHGYRGWSTMNYEPPPPTID